MPAEGRPWPSDDDDDDDGDGDDDDDDLTWVGFAATLQGISAASPTLRP